MPEPAPSAIPRAPQPGEWLTQHDAAVLCAIHYDTIRRHRRSGALRSRTRADGTIDVPVADLVGAGLLSPTAATGDVAEIAGRSRAERDLAATRQELAVTRARLDAALERAERAESEVAFLRALVKQQGRAA